MNAAAKVGHPLKARAIIMSLALSRLQVVTISLVFSIVISALSLVYVTNSARTLHASLQQTVSEQNRLQVQWAQLLLEKSTLTFQSRVQHFAEDKMDMMVPNHQSVVIVNE